MKLLEDMHLKTQLVCCISRPNCVREKICRKKAESVLKRIMGRSRINVEKIVAKLSTMGYVFKYPEAKHIFPIPNIRERIERLERNGVFLPLSLRFWFTLVGSVNLMGTHPDWERSGYRFKASQRIGAWYRDPGGVPWFTDPLVVEDGLLDDAVENWRCRDEYAAESGGKRSCSIEISPDNRHKANISGGASYELNIEDPSIDTALLNEPHNVFFVDYLRIAFSWGGFPGAESIAGFPSPFVHELRKDLLPI